MSLPVSQSPSLSFSLSHFSEFYIFFVEQLHLNYGELKLDRIFIHKCVYIFREAVKDMLSLLFILYIVSF